MGSSKDVDSIKWTNYRRLKEYLSSISNPNLRNFVNLGVERLFDCGDLNTIRHGLALHSYPVHVEEFLFGGTFLRRPKDELYPSVVDELIKINEEHGRIVNSLTEFVGTGGIGSAKTTTALYTNAYQLYLLSCYKNPHSMFGLDSTSEILFIFQSLNATISKEVDYARFRAICSQSYYFTSVFPFQRHYESSLKFPNRVECKPIGSDGGAIGQNVLGGLIDEVNFMSIVEASKKSAVGGLYDQARVIYDSVSRRIKTRFVNNGGQPGILCLVSSKNYPGEFTDVKLREAETDPTIYVYDKRVWDIKPKGTFCGEVFHIFIGDELRKPRILESRLEVSEGDSELVMPIPVEFRKSFEGDMLGSLRDIAGVGTSSRFPYILNSDKVTACFGVVPSVLSLNSHDFSSEQQLQFFPDRVSARDIPRWVHVDLSINGDCTGIACGYVSGFRPISAESEEVMPSVVFDFVLRVVPPKGDEIKIHRIRELFYKLRDKGLPIRWVTFDSYQSVDSVQLLRQQGFTTGFISTDTTIHPYEMAKTAFYEGRIMAPDNPIALREFLTLEKVRANTKIKIDHPPTGSKDCSDAMASVVYGLTTRREIWGMYGIPLTRVPDSIKVVQQSNMKG